MADYNLSTSDDGVPTHTSDEQANAEDACHAVFEEWANTDGSLARDA